MKTIKLKFTDFWDGFNEKNNFFYHLLSKRFNVILSDDPELIIYSVFGKSRKKFKCPKIFYAGEYIGPRGKRFSFTFFENSEMNYRLPLYRIYPEYPALFNKRPDKIPEKFCNFVYNNGKPQDRIKFFNILNKYKKVDSAGRILNNIGHKTPYEDKGYRGISSEFLKQYKFTIAFENTERQGYTTEKIMNPLAAGSVPIYCGNPNIHEDFNSSSYINCRDYKDLKEAADYVIELDKNDKLYMQYLTSTPFKDNKEPDFLNENTILDMFEKIFNRLLLDKYYPKNIKKKKKFGSMKPKNEILS